MNLAFAWVSAVCVFLLYIIYPFRVLLKKVKLLKEHILKNVNLLLRRIHRPLGIITIIIVFIHCRIAFQSSGIRSFVGGVLLLLMVLIALTFQIRKMAGGIWVKAHRILSHILISLSIYHMFFEF